MIRLFLPLLYCFPAMLYAWDTNDVAKLKTTKICERCDLSKSDLRWANVYAAEIDGAPNLVGAVMSFSNLTGSNLYGANLEGAKLIDSDLSGANLSWASLLYADLTGANLTDAKLRGAIFCGTIMPNKKVNNKNC